MTHFSLTIDEDQQDIFKSLAESDYLSFLERNYQKGAKGIPYLRASQGSLKIKPIVLNLKSKF